MKIKLGKKKVAKKSAKVEGKKKSKIAVVAGSAVADMTPTLAKVVARADSALELMKKGEAQFKEALVEIRKVLGEGRTSFKHPKLGYLSVMKRGTKIYWRPKPNGHG